MIKKAWNSHSNIHLCKYLTWFCIEIMNRVLNFKEIITYVWETLNVPIHVTVLWLLVWFPQFWRNTQYSPSCSAAAMPSGMNHCKEGERRGGIKLRKDGFYVSCLLMLWHTLISVLCMLAFCSCKDVAPCWVSSETWIWLSKKGSHSLTCL